MTRAELEHKLDAQLVGPEDEIKFFIDENAEHLDELNPGSKMKVVEVIGAEIYLEPL